MLTWDEFRAKHPAEAAEVVRIGELEPGREAHAWSELVAAVHAHETARCQAHDLLGQLVGRRDLALEAMQDGRPVEPADYLAHAAGSVPVARINEIMAPLRALSWVGEFMAWINSDGEKA